MWCPHKFQQKNNKERNNAQNELQRALAAIVGEQGLAGAPLRIGPRTICVAVKETSAKLWDCIRKGKFEVTKWRTALDIDTKSSELMPPHMLCFTMAWPTTHKKVMYDIYLALKVRFPKIVRQFIQSAEEAPRSIPPDTRALCTFKLSNMTMASSQQENK
jgi:hypothetical protein